MSMIDQLRLELLAAAAAAKQLQSCLTLHDPIDGSPPGSPIPGILQARTLEWVAISFSVELFGPPQTSYSQGKTFPVQLTETCPACKTIPTINHSICNLLILLFLVHIAMTKYQTGWLINNRNVFLTVLEAGKSKIKVLAHQVFGESLLFGSQTEPSSSILTWQKELGSSVESLQEH